MEHYRKTSHSIYDLKVHLVWITKYRKPILSGAVTERVRELIREICKVNDVEILRSHVSIDHVHLFVSVPSYLSISKLVQSIKGKTSRKMLTEFKVLNKQYWDCHMWVRGYFAASSGNITDEVIMQYLENQDIEEEKDDNFRISP